jgi:hypothetical protein
MNRKVALIFLVLLTIATGMYSSLAFAGKEEKAGVKDEPPAFFVLHSTSGNERFVVSCMLKDVDVTKCAFDGLRISPPDTRKAFEEFEKFKKLYDTAIAEGGEKEVRRQFKDMFNLDHMKAQLADPSIGPKTKQSLRELITVADSGDYLQTMKFLSFSYPGQTCLVSSQAFSLEFKRIGPMKWLHNTGVSGLCNIVKIYELSGQLNKDSVYWSLTETRVTAGLTSGICEDVTEELNKPTVWKQLHPKVFELPCDFAGFK